MCWIMTKPKGNPIPYDFIAEAQKKNKDGYGVSWYENSEIHTFKTLDFIEFNEKLKTIEDHLMVVHLRNATVGTSTCTANVHPFPVPTGVMFHNGTISNLRCSTAAASDTNQLAQAVSACKFKKVEDIAPLLQIITGNSINRLVFLNNNGTLNIINKHLGIDDPNGNWYSNDYHIKEDTTLIFVYGTLKEGYSNNMYYMYNADYIDEAKSVEKYAMIGKNMGFPYLLGKHKDGYNIKGELYEAPPSTMRLLDQLEGYPTHYDKTIIEVADSKGQVHQAVTYIKAKLYQRDLDSEFIEEFTGTKARFKYNYSKYNSAFDDDI